ncbi:unnamed protein product [Arctogadus glacialis]
MSSTIATTSKKLCQISQVPDMQSARYAKHQPAAITILRGEQQEWNNRSACEGTESWNPWRWSVFEEEKEEEEKMEEEEDRLGNGRETVLRQEDQESSAEVRLRR